MRFLNMARRSGKTTMLIYTANAIGVPIITMDKCRAANIKMQAKKLGLDVEVYDLYEWNRSTGTRKDILIDEAEQIIKLALNSYLNADVLACTFTIPMIERIIKKKETEDEADIH